jgi:arabinogalactan oligomer/maltooligosaccharide transport system permease protein
VSRRGAAVESALVHALLLAAVGFAIYPLLWVITLAFTAGGLGAQSGVLPFPRAPSLENFRLVLGLGGADRAWL